MKVHNFLVNFLNELYSITQDAETVIWVGMHPWITTIYQFLEECGIKRFEVVDNNIEIQGNEIWTYKSHLVKSMLVVLRNLMIVLYI